MHELSIAHHIAEIAEQYRQQIAPARILTIHLKVGALTCVHSESLLFSFDLVTAETPLAGAKLAIETIPIAIFCPKCEALRQLPGVQMFRCPICETPSADIRQGRELDIDTIDWLEPTSDEDIADKSSTILRHPHC